MLNVKLQYFGHQMWKQLIVKFPDTGKYQGEKEKRASEDEMAGDHH